MISYDKLKKDYKLAPSLAASYCLMFSYAKDAADPIVFVHYTHEHHISSPVSYLRNNKMCTLFIFLSGKFGFVFDKAVCNPAYGDVVMIRDHEKYTACFYSNSHVDYYEINFPVEFFDKISAPNPFYHPFYERNEGERNMVVLDRIACDAMIGKLKEIETLIHTKNTYTDLLAYSYVLQIMEIITAQYGKSSGKPSATRIPAKLKTAVDYIHCNFSTIASVDEVASHCGVTSTYLSRMFKNSLLCTPNEYITNLRISHAKYLLSSGCTLTDACYKSGFNNYTYFISKFKSVVGVTPANFKKGL